MLGNRSEYICEIVDFALNQYIHKTRMCQNNKYYFLITFPNGMLDIKFLNALKEQIGHRLTKEHLTYEFCGIYSNENFIITDFYEKVYNKDYELIASNKIKIKDEYIKTQALNLKNHNCDDLNKTLEINNEIQRIISKY